MVRFESFDVIVVGAGVGGCCAAIVTAKNSLKTLLIDRLAKQDVGKKICGDGVAKNHINFVEQNLGIKFGTELGNFVTGIDLYSPDLDTKLEMNDSGYILDRPRFGQRLMQEAIKAGATFRERCLAVDLMYEDSRVGGVMYRNQAEGTAKKVKAKLVIEATGVVGTLKRKLSIPHQMEVDVDKADLELTYRENRILNGSEIDPERAIIDFNQKYAPGGYTWLFPKGKDKVNVGLGIKGTRSEKPQTYLAEYYKGNEKFGGLFKGSSLDLADEGKDFPFGAASWSVTVRRQNDCLVAPGFMILGDTAWVPNPVSAGGIGPALDGGVLAGKTAVRAVQENDVSEGNLWEYNVNYFKHYGSKTPPLEAFRIFLQSLGDRQLNYGMRHFITSHEIDKISIGETPQISTLSKLQKLLWSLGDMHSFRGLLYARKKMKALSELYEAYPEKPELFSAWMHRVNLELGEVRSRFAAAS